VLLATDADWLRDDVAAALATGDTEVFRVRKGRDVLDVVDDLEPDLIIADMQIGSMGGIATTLALRNAEEDGRIEPPLVLLLLDRGADAFMAEESGADGWMVKPVDAFRLRRATDSLFAGDGHFEGNTKAVAAREAS